MRLTNLLNVVAACGAGFLGGMLASRAPVQAASPPIIRASRFELLDSTGVAVAQWETNPRTKEVHISFLSKTGDVALEMGILPDARAFLTMNGHDKKSRFHVGLDQQEKPGLVMSDERWLGRIVLGHQGTDTPDIPDSTDQWILGFHPFGTTRSIALMGMTDAGGRGTEGVLFVNGAQIR